MVSFTPRCKIDVRRAPLVCLAQSRGAQGAASRLVLPLWVIVGLNRWAMALPGSRKRPTDNGELLREERFYDSESHTRTFVKVNILFFFFSRRENDLESLRILTNLGRVTLPETIAPSPHDLGGGLSILWPSIKTYPRSPKPSRSASAAGFAAPVPA